jgi:hypothetical protein
MRRHCALLPHRQTNPPAYGPEAGNFPKKAHSPAQFRRKKIFLNLALLLVPVG